MRVKALLTALAMESLLSLLCSSVNVGTDAHSVDVVKSGTVQGDDSAAAWGAYPTQHYSPTTSDFYLYIDGPGFLAPDFHPSQILEFHHKDEVADLVQTWVRMNVTQDYEDRGIAEKLTVYRVQQECAETSDGGYTMLLNLTFSAPTCDPIVINWYKSCGEPNQPASSLNIGFLKGSKELVSRGVPTVRFDSDLSQEVYEVPVHMSSLSLVLHTEKGKQVYVSRTAGESVSRGHRPCWRGCSPRR